MQCNRTLHNCGADIADGPTSAPDVVESTRVKEPAVILGRPVVEHQGRDYLGRSFGVAGIDDVGIPVTDK